MYSFDTLPNQVAELSKQIIGLKDFISENLLKSENEKVFNIQQLAEYLKVSKATIHNYKKNKKFPFYKAGKTVYFKKCEVDLALSNKARGGVIK